MSEVSVFERVKEATLTSDVATVMADMWRNDGRHVYRFNPVLVSRLLSTYDNANALCKFYQSGVLRQLPVKTLVLRDFEILSDDLKDLLKSMNITLKTDAIVTISDNELVATIYKSVNNSKRLLLSFITVSLMDGEVVYSVRVVESAVDAALRTGFASGQKFVDSLARSILPSLLTELVYLAADNADVQKIPHKAFKQHGNKKATKFKEFYVGGKSYEGSIELGVNLKCDKTYVPDPSKEHIKSPHIRKAHFHLYHRKEGDVIHWLDPIAVHGGVAPAVVG